MNPCYLVKKEPCIPIQSLLKSEHQQLFSIWMWITHYSVVQNVDSLHPAICVVLDTIESLKKIYQTASKKHVLTILMKFLSTSL